MKIKHSIIIFLIGYCLSAIGSLLRILHQYGADFVLIIATILIVTGIIIFACKLLTSDKFKDFLNQ